MPDWADQGNDKQKRYRDLTTSIDSGAVRQARTGKKTRRKQVSQTIHFNDEIADEVKAAVERLSEEWSVPKNDVWQFIVQMGLRAAENGEERPSFGKVGRKIIFK